MTTEGTIGGRPVWRDTVSGRWSDFGADHMDARFTAIRQQRADLIAAVVEAARHLKLCWGDVDRIDEAEREFLRAVDALDADREASS